MGRHHKKLVGFFLFCLNMLKALRQNSISSNRGSLNSSSLVRNWEYVHWTKKLVSFESNLLTVLCSQHQPFRTTYLRGKTLCPTACHLLHDSSVIPTLVAWRSPMQSGRHLPTLPMGQRDSFALLPESFWACLGVLTRWSPSTDTKT